MCSQSSLPLTSLLKYLVSLLDYSSYTLDLHNLYVDVYILELPIARI